MPVHASVAERLARLAPDQREAATAPPGPLLCVAPAGSGKTTTLVARVAWLVDGGADPSSVCLVAFNRRAAEELVGRVDAALAPLGMAPGLVRVRTFHALGREILADAGADVSGLVDRLDLLRERFPDASRADLGRLDLAFSRLKVDLRVTAADVARDPAPGPVARAFLAYEEALRARGGLDFDDLLGRAVAALAADPALLAAWRRRTATLLVDEAQDLDRTQLDLAILLAGPARNVCLVGDDDQSIYGWRLADVRRVLGLAAALPGLRRVDLETNYRCPRPVVERAVRLVEHNRERFAKRIRAGPAARGGLVLAPDAADDLVRIGRAMDAWPADGTTRAVLARTNRELLVAIVAAVERGVPFRAPELALPIEDPRLDGLLERLTGGRLADLPLLVALGRLRSEARAANRDLRAANRDLRADPAFQPDWAAGVPAGSPAGGPGSGATGPARPPEEVPEADLVTALLGWAASLPEVGALQAAVSARRSALGALRQEGAALTLATAHGTKGLEWDHVLVLADGFPGRRSVSDAAEPERALEEERRLAYVAWTRARRSLTLLYDPESPSPFLLEAFSPAELSPDVAAAARR